MSQALPKECCRWALSLALATGVGGAEDARAAFERPPLDTRSAALGGILAVSPDPVFGNPALAIEPGGAMSRGAGARPSAASRGRTVAVFEVARPFGLPELSEAQAGWARRGPWSVACGGRRFGTHSYAEMEARLGLSHDVGRAVIGAAVRYLQVGGEGFSTRRGVAVDWGLRAEPDPGFVLGVVAEAVLGSVPGDTSGRGRRTSVGVAHGVGPLRLHAEAQRTEDTPLAVVLGTVWEPRSGLALSVGVRESPAAVAGGFTLPLPGALVSTAATWVPPLGTTLRLGVQVGRRPR